MISRVSASIAAAAMLAGLTVNAQNTTPAVSDPGFLQLRYVTVVVRDYEEALKWYTDVLGWRKVEDRAFGPGQRWIVVAPALQSNIGIVLDHPNADRPGAGRAADAMRNYSDRIGKETNWVFQVGDCAKLYEILSKRGVKFLAPPRTQPWGTSQAIFEDLYGNVFVVESTAAHQAPE
jgi:catechol 2,3-dioxygenase-like lactoylglutathione lyase family enzyme